jgi:hypothetical protein
MVKRKTHQKEPFINLVRNAKGNLLTSEKMDRMPDSTAFFREIPVDMIVVL